MVSSFWNVETFSIILLLLFKQYLQSVLICDMHSYWIHLCVEGVYPAASAMIGWYDNPEQFDWQLACQLSRVTGAMNLKIFKRASGVIACQTTQARIIMLTEVTHKSAPNSIKLWKSDYRDNSSAWKKWGPWPTKDILSIA